MGIISEGYMARTKSKVSNRNNGKFKNPASLPVSVPRVDLQRLVSFADSPLYKGYEFKPYNPDDLWQKRSNYDLYDKMRIDEQVKAALHLIKYAILGTGWDIVQEDDHRPDILEFVRENLFEQYSGELEDAWWEILSAIDYGFSMTEMVFKLKNGKQWLSELFTIPPHSLDLWTDDKGRIFKIEQDTVHDVDFELPLWKMIYLVNNPEFRNPYGVSDLRAAYRAWWSKDNILKFWNIYLERFGTPPIHATFDETAVQRSETSDILDILKSIQQKTEIVTPNSVKLDTIESKRSTTTDYKAAIEEYNLQIAKSLLVPSLSGVVNETKGGSFALGKGQIDLFLLGNEKRRRQFADVINEQLIRKLVIINFGEQESYPEFKFKSLDEQNQLEIVKLWTELTKVGVEIHTEDDSRHIRNILGFPEPQKQVKPPEPKPKEKEEDMTLKFQEFPTIPNPSRPKTK